MIGPVSETGKVMLSSLQGAMSKGMPVDQAITYVKSMAQQGVAPLVDLYSLLKQFERMKQPPASMPQGGTVKDQLSNLESAMTGGLGGMQPGAMSAAPQMQGLASLDAGRMENPQGFAGGGIVAFAEGGQPEERKSITPELYTLPQSYEELARQRAAEAARLKTAEGRAALEAEIDAENKRLGIGSYAPSLGMREAYAKRKGEEAEALAGEEAALNEESFWADVAGTDQPDFVSALAKSKAKAVERKRAAKDKVQGAKDKAEELKIVRQEAREALKNKDYETYKTKMEQAKTLSETSVSDYLKDKTARERAQEAAKNARTLAGIQKGVGTPEYELRQKFASTPMYIKDAQGNEVPNPEYGRLKRRLADLQGVKRSGGVSSDVRYYQDVYNDKDAAYRQALKAYNDYQTPESKAALDQAAKERDAARANYERASLGEDFAVPPPAAAGGASAFDPSAMSDEEIMAALGSG